MERSSGHEAFLQPFMFVTGVMAFDSYWDDRATAALSLARVGKQTVNPFSFGAGTGEYAITGRLTGLPVYQEDGRRLLHLGIGYDYSGTDADQFAVANRPLVRAGAGSQQVPDIIRTGTFFTSDPVQILNVEFATVLNRLSLSAEYLLARGTNIFEQFSAGNFSGPRGNATYHGMYVEAGMFLNPADYRRYNKAQAVWDRQIVTDHTPVQLVCRYSYLDLTSGTPVLTQTSGTQAGQEHDITAGVNWYFNSQAHFMVNYVYTDLDYVDCTSGAINGLGCRLHLDF
jgi:phosphate-selective porin OprO/OprP